jgi:hypothetical protein
LYTIEGVVRASCDTCGAIVSLLDVYVKFLYVLFNITAMPVQKVISHDAATFD